MQDTWLQIYELLNIKSHCNLFLKNCYCAPNSLDNKNNLLHRHIPHHFFCYTFRHLVIWDLKHSERTIRFIYKFPGKKLKALFQYFQNLEPLLYLLNSAGKFHKNICGTFFIASFPSESQNWIWKTKLPCIFPRSISGNTTSCLQCFCWCWQ